MRRRPGTEKPGPQPAGDGNGGDRGDRTPNLGIANAALSQLSYVPTKAANPANAGE